MTVQVGPEYTLRSGVVCIEDFKARGNKKTEEKIPQLEIDIVSLAETESQIDLNFKRRLNTCVSQPKPCDRL